MSKRIEILNSNHDLSADFYLAELQKRGGLVFNGHHSYEKGHEFLASNEFDWFQNLLEPVPTDIVIGFGTNSLWDLALNNNAKYIVIADWSPWPIIAHAFLLSPLLRLAESPQEFIYMINGMPRESAFGKTLEQAFDETKKFSMSILGLQQTTVTSFLLELASNQNISDTELKFITTFLRPRLGDNLHSKTGYGPFPELKSPNEANLTYYFERRYSPKVVGSTATAFSSVQNFQRIKEFFAGGKVGFAVANVTDVGFYRALTVHEDFKNLRDWSISLSNIFECGDYNGLTPTDFQTLTAQLKQIFAAKVVHLYRTTGRVLPYNYVRTKL